MIGVPAFHLFFQTTLLKAAVFGLFISCFWAVPDTASAADNVAVIIGNKSGFPNSANEDYAHRNADAFRQFVVEKMGYKAENIIDLRDATLPVLEKVFGTNGTFLADISRYLGPLGGSEITIYYSGDGATGAVDGRPYLLPTGANPDKVEVEGYSLDQFFKNLGSLTADSISVFLETSFSDKPDIKTAMPGVGTYMSVLIATKSGQVAHPDNAARLGMFTRNLLDALDGSADGDFYGNTDGTISFDELKNYLDRNMTVSVKRRFEKVQTAALYGLADGEFYILQPKASPPHPLADMMDDSGKLRDTKLVSRSDTDICVFATKKGGTAWETVGTDFQSFIDEAKSRQMDLEKCEKLLSAIDKKASRRLRPRSASANPDQPFDGSYAVHMQCPYGVEWKGVVAVTDGVMALNGAGGGSIIGESNDAGEITMDGTLDDKDGSRFKFWAEVKVANGRMDGRSIIYTRHAPISCAFNGDRR
jgi:hypothetical protein